MFTFKREPSKIIKNEKRPQKNFFLQKKKALKKPNNNKFFVRTSSTSSFLIAKKIKNVVGPTDEYHYALVPDAKNF